MERKERVKNWLKKPHNLVFLGIMVLAIVIRLYYFVLTKNQPLWFDEADYMAYAKNLAGINNGWTVTPQHNSLFPYLAAGLIRLGFTEPALKFFLEILPSILLVFLVYYICIEMYKDKRIALISAFIIATFWNILFNTMRFHLEAIGMLFAFLAIYIFWKGYEKKQDIFGKIKYKWAIPLTIILVVLTYAIRRGYFLFGVFFLIYVLLTKDIMKLIKDKYNWFGLILGLIVFFIIENTIFNESIIITSGSYLNTKIAVSTVPFTIFSTFFSQINGSMVHTLFYLFYVGIILMIFLSFLSMGYFRKEKYSTIRADLFAILSIVLTMAYFLFYQRTATIGDPRWYYPLLLASFIAISKGAIFIGDFFKKYNKYLAVILILLLIGYGGYYQVQHADIIINAKVNTYEGIKQAGLYVNEISQPEDTILCIADSQSSYYSERETIRPINLMNASSNQEFTVDQFANKLQDIENKHVKYLIVTFSEPNHPDWMVKQEYVQDTQTGQPILSKWEIQFMDTTINFLTGEQDIKQSQTYGEIEFKLLNIFEDSFVYEIIRN